MSPTKVFPFAASLALSLLALPPVAHARECEGHQMPERVELGETALTLNGMGIREATVLNVDVYVAGLYLENRSRDPAQILGSEQIKHLRLRLVRDVSRDEMLQALQAGLEQNAGDAYPLLQERMRKLGGWITELQDGDRISFTYVPEQGLQVRNNGKLAGTIEGSDFARAFLAIWIGGRPADDDLRRGLLGGRCG